MIGFRSGSTSGRVIRSGFDPARVRRGRRFGPDGPADRPLPRRDQRRPKKWLPRAVWSSLV